MGNLNKNDEQNLVSDPEIEALKKRISKLESVIKILAERDTAIVNKLNSVNSITVGYINSSDSNIQKLKDNDDKLLNGIRNLYGIALPGIPS